MSRHAGSSLVPDPLIPMALLAVRSGSGQSMPPPRPSATARSWDTLYSCASILQWSVLLASHVQVGTQANILDKRIYQEICAQRLGSGFEITCIAHDTAWSEPGARANSMPTHNLNQYFLGA